jgi:hypothetical protein
LAGNPQNGKLTVILPGVPVPESPWVTIPSCSTAQHAEIAKRFIEQVDDPVKRVALQDIVDRVGSGPSSGFHEKVRESGLGPQWARFRRDRVLEYLAAALDSAGIDPVEVVAVEKPKPPVRPPESAGDYSAPRPASRMGINIQQVVTAAVGRMSDAELRNLPIPLGYILDIIGNR